MEPWIKFGDAANVLSKARQAWTSGKSVVDCINGNKIFITCSIPTMIKHLDYTDSINILKCCCECCRSGSSRYGNLLFETELWRVDRGFYKHEKEEDAGE